eukprot:4867987-Prymnesium_polylepis.2
MEEEAPPPPQFKEGRACVDAEDKVRNEDVCHRSRPVDIRLVTPQPADKQRHRDHIERCQRE